MTTTLVPTPPTSTSPGVGIPGRSIRSGPTPPDATIGRGRRLVRGRPDDGPWVRPALLTLLAGTALLYLWGLGASGWANTFYSAAVQAGTVSWKAAFFGSSDAANAITVDKIPGSLWIMEASTRIFGVNAWSILVPQALEGVAAVGILYLAVRRWYGPAAGLVAGAVLALTPVATLMFRFNNPDALLVLLLTGGAYALTRALERADDKAGTRWLLLAFSLVGFGFLAKMLQAFLVVPVFGLVYLVAAPTRLRRRIGQLALAAGALLASAGWWVAIVELWPASSRPYIGGSQDNSVLNLLFGYNGFGRLTGNETGSVGGGGAGGTGQWGATGWSRLFNSEFGGQASWLLPAAAILLVAGLVACGRARRTDRTRAGLLLWGGWLVVTAAVFSFGQGIIHPYYAVALAPAIGAVVGIGATSFWARRADPLARAVLASALAATVAWGMVLFHRSPTWLPWLSGPLLAAGLGLAATILLTPRLRGRVGALVAAGALTVALAGPAASSITTAAAVHGGAIPSAGPTVVGGRGFGGPAGGFGGAPGNATGTRPAGGPAGGIGGLLDGSTPSAELVAVLQADAGDYRWVAAAIGSNQAAGYQLGTGDPVMAIGGFNGSDASPTLAQFQQDVADGQIHYFVASTGGFGGGGGQGQSSSTSNAISSWVTSTFTSTTVGGVTLYDLTSPAT